MGFKYTVYKAGYRAAEEGESLEVPRYLYDYEPEASGSTLTLASRVR
jgi:hypothetical protein